MPHIKDPKRFKAFYEELGNDPKQLAQQVVARRIAFIQPQGSIIELGCHAGFNSLFWAEQGHCCVGVDIAQTLIDEAERRRSRLSPEVRERVSFIQSDILDLDSKGIGKFDTVILTEVLEHVIEPDSIVEKAMEFMRPSSKMYIAAPSKRIGTYAHVRGISETYLSDLGDKLGLDIQFVREKKVIHYINTQAIATLKEPDTGR